MAQGSPPGAAYYCNKCSGCDPAVYPNAPKGSSSSSSNKNSVKQISTKPDVFISSSNNFSDEVKNNSNNILIIDTRNAKDPNMQIVNSYRITEKQLQKEIITIMQIYNKQHPVDPAWERTNDSMITEWDFHNFAHSLNYKPERTADTDFNNADEGKGFLDFVFR